MEECSGCKSRIIRLHKGEKLLTEWEARHQFWKAICIARPESIQDLRCILPQYTKSCLVDENADFPDCVAFRSLSEFSDGSFIASLTRWRERWGLNTDWLVPCIDSTLDDLARGRYKTPSICFATKPLPKPCPKGVNNPQCRLQLWVDYEERERSRHRQEAPTELGLRFEDWWYLPRGETRDEARDRITESFRVELSAYLSRVQDHYAPHMRKFHEKHFQWLALRVVPDGLGRRARVEEIDHDRSEVSRKTCALAKFVGVDIPPQPRSRNTVRR